MKASSLSQEIFKNSNKILGEIFFSTPKWMTSISIPVYWFIQAYFFFRSLSFHFPFSRWPTNQIEVEVSDSIFETEAQPDIEIEAVEAIEATKAVEAIEATEAVEAIEAANHQNPVEAVEGKE